MAVLAQTPYSSQAPSPPPPQAAAPQPQQQEEIPAWQKYIYYPIKGALRIPHMIFKVIWSFLWRYYK
jgi:hypothetical protein